MENKELQKKREDGESFVRKNRFVFSGRMESSSYNYNLRPDL